MTSGEQLMVYTMLTLLPCLCACGADDGTGTASFSTWGEEYIEREIPADPSGEDGFVDGWRDRIVNIHPSLLPAFKGRHPQRQALEAGVRETGCTVHYVRPAMDSGPIIARAKVPVFQHDDEAALSARILEAEHRLYPLVMELIAEGQVAVRGEDVMVGERARQALGMAEN